MPDLNGSNCVFLVRRDQTPTQRMNQRTKEDVGGDMSQNKMGILKDKGKNSFRFVILIFTSTMYR